MVAQTLTMPFFGVTLALPSIRDKINYRQGCEGIHSQQVYVIGDSPVTLPKHVFVEQEWVVGHEPFLRCTLHLSCNGARFDRKILFNLRACA